MMVLDTSASSIVLGLFSLSHLGDAVCTTTLPRKISEKYHKTVYAFDHASTVAVFANNPYVKGFRSEGYINLTDKLIGFGHTIQRLERAFELPIDPIPKPELYFSDEELKWARQQRQQWPQNKPICILNTGCVTDEMFESYADLEWHGMIEVLNNYFTVVHPAITSKEHYTKVFELDEDQRENWKPDKLVGGVIQYANLPTRHYLALFKVADCYCGPTGGGMHVAAALEVPALVILNRKSRPERIKFPNEDPGFPTEAFLYPQHTFARTDDLYHETFDYSKFSKVIETTITKCPLQG